MNDEQLYICRRINGAWFDLERAYESNGVTVGGDLLESTDELRSAQKKIATNLYTTAKNHGIPDDKLSRTLVEEAIKEN